MFILRFKLLKLWLSNKGIVYGIATIPQWIILLYSAKYGFNDATVASIQVLFNNYVEYIMWM